MREVKEMFYVCLAVGVVLLLIWWVGQAIAWQKTRVNTQRKLCVQQTHNGYFCNLEW